MRGTRAYHAALVATVVWCLGLLAFTVLMIQCSPNPAASVSQLVRRAADFRIEALGVTPP